MKLGYSFKSSVINDSLMNEAQKEFLLKLYSIIENKEWCESLDDYNIIVVDNNIVDLYNKLSVKDQYLVNYIIGNELKHRDNECRGPLNVDIDELNDTSVLMLSIDRR